METGIENKISVNDEMPEHLAEFDIYSKTVGFITKTGQVFKGWYRYDFGEWIVSGTPYDHLNVTHWWHLDEPNN